MSLDDLLLGLPLELHQVVSRLIVENKVKSKEDIVLLPREAVEKASNSSAIVADALLAEVSRPLLSTPVRSLQELVDVGISRVTTGDTLFDEFLSGGLPLAGIHEISGVAGSGKTSIALQICCQALINQGAAVFLTTQAFPSQRWQQVVSSRVSEVEQKTFSDRLFILTVHTADGLLQSLSRDLLLLLRRDLVRLVVLDSIADLFRADFGEDYSGRAKVFGALSQRMHNLSAEFRLPFLVINQVTDIFESELGELGPYASSKHRPALGLAWANCITTRFMIEKTNRTIGETLVNSHIEESGNFPPKKRRRIEVEVMLRRLAVIFAPNLPFREIHFFLDNKGATFVNV